MKRLAWLLALMLAACAAPPQDVRPALWQVDGPQGQKAWLFGTVHALPRPVNWHSPVLDSALAGSDALVVEIADLDGAKLGKAFAAVSRTPGLPPLPDRAGIDLRPGLDRLLDEADQSAEDLRPLETWAVALTLASAAQPADAARNGIDRALIAAADGKPVVELEGAAAQFAIFDHLPEAQQRTLLRAVIAGSAQAAQDSARLAEAWGKGDMAVIGATTREGFLSDPGLRQALYTGRNRNWTRQLTAMMAQGRHPFVAVGAAHLAGDESLPALLAAQGYTVRRVQ